MPTIRRKPRGQKIYPLPRYLNELFQRREQQQQGCQTNHAKRHQHAGYAEAHQHTLVWDRITQTDSKKAHEGKLLIHQFVHLHQKCSGDICLCASMSPNPICLRSCPCICSASVRFNQMLLWQVCRVPHGFQPVIYQPAYYGASLLRDEQGA